MSYNKSRHVDSAQKYLHQDKVAQAIAEYQNILKHEPRDQVTLMTIGDLYVRHEETRPVERLAELYVQQGVLSEARPIYLHLADVHERAGRKPEAAGLLRK